MDSASPPRRPRPSPRPAPRAEAAPVQAEAAPLQPVAELAPELPSGPAPRPRIRANLRAEVQADLEPAGGGVIRIGDEEIRVPGLLAAVRRNPRNVQRASVGAVAAGIALFVIASLATPLASADTAERHHAPATPSATPTFEPAPTIAIVSPAAPAVRKTLKRKPTHVKTKAPVSHGVISGLAANGIPKVALNAYRVAAARMANVDPGCGIDWALIAGIGREESDHGRFAGAQLHADGTSTPRIIGPALDGVHWDFIPAPGNGMALDGDAQFAHALGPMQFIPSTWASYGADATGDGKADIFNINDAALGTARYLCAAGGNLRTHAGQVAGVLTYNHSDEYLAQVLALANAYRTGVPISGIPLGITKGKLPKITDTGYIPPANPGAPTAVDKDKKKAKHKAATPKKKHKSTGTSPGSSGSKSTPTSGKTTGAGGGKTTSKPSTKPTTKPTGQTTSPKPPPASSTSPTPKPSKTCTLQMVLELKCLPGT